jgi:hypothetical protein
VFPASDPDAGGLVGSGKIQKSTGREGPKSLGKRPFQAKNHGGSGGKKFEKNRRAAVYRGIFTAKTQIEERRATRRPRKFRRRIPRGSDRHRANSVEIPRTHSTETRSSVDRTDAGTNDGSAPRGDSQNDIEVGQPRRSIDERTAGRPTNDAYVVRQRARRTRGGTDGRTRGRRRHSATHVRLLPRKRARHTRKARSFKRRRRRRRRLYREVAAACAFADFHRLGTRRRREVADKQSKTSAPRFLLSGLNGPLGIHAIRCTSSRTDRR